MVSVALPELLGARQGCLAMIAATSAKDLGRRRVVAMAGRFLPFAAPFPSRMAVPVGLA